MFGKMNTMSPETFAKTAEETLLGKLVSAVLYGSAAAGDHSEKSSDYNVLLVLADTDLATLAPLSSLFKSWTSAGNPSPLIFTEEGLAGSADVFPIEMLDIADAHRILAGRDVVSGISVSRANLRHQVEFELRSKLLALRGAAIAAGSHLREMAEALQRTYSPLASNLRAALRLYEETVPSEKLAAINALARHIEFDPSAFATLAEAKASGGKIHSVQAFDLLSNLLKALESVVAAVDALP